MTNTYRVTPKAQDDLKNIGRYSAKKWGNAQRDRYLKNLEKRFAWLAENPLLGKHRPDVVEGYYSFPQAEHIVFYLIHSSGVDIIGVPHKEMDTLTYFHTN